MNVAIVTSIIFGFAVYLFSAKKLLEGAQISEGGMGVIYTIPAAAIGGATGLVLYFIIEGVKAFLC